MKKRSLLGFLILPFAFIWRAWFGGSFGYCWRWVKYLVGIAIILAMYYIKDILDWNNWHMYAVCISFMIFWALSHGMWFKYWDHSSEAEDRHPLFVKFVMLLCGGPEQSRSFWGNFIGMTVRYTLTAILVAILIPNLWFCFAGLIVGVSYIPAGLAHNTKIGEFIAGPCVFTLLFFCI